MDGEEVLGRMNNGMAAAWTRVSQRLNRQCRCPGGDCASLHPPSLFVNVGNRQGGLYAQFAAAGAEHVGRVPKRLDVREAGAVATGLTALQGIDALELRPGQTVLIFGASGAVGTMALQFAVQRGAHVIATA